MAMNPFKNLGALEKYGREFNETMSNLYDKINEFTEKFNKLIDHLETQEKQLASMQKELEVIKNGLKKS
jgi:archaellum component FlaC